MLVFARQVKRQWDWEQESLGGAVRSYGPGLGGGLGVERNG